MAVLLLAMSAAAVMAISTHRFSAATRRGPLADAGSFDTSDLPLVELPARHRSGMLAVLVSGDGGWRAIDQNVSAGLNARGISVVGLVAPTYFARRRTPDEASNALARIISHYNQVWQTRRVIVVGYSRGAGVLPFMITRLPPALRRNIQEIALLGLERTIDFHFSARELLFDAPAELEIPVRGEIEKLRGSRILCFYGVHESDSLCRELAPPLATRVAEPGSHHFSGDYDQLARTIWREAIDNRQLILKQYEYE